MYQDNQSTRKMEINGRNYCTGNSRHIDRIFHCEKQRNEQKSINYGLPYGVNVGWIFYKGTTR